MAEMDVELVAVEGRLWSGAATFVFARTKEGEIGILPGHEATLAQLEDSGLVRIDTTQGAPVTAAVHGGFLSITPDQVTVLAETAELAEEIDVGRARDALSRAGSADSADSDDAARARERAEVRLRVAEASR